MFNSKMLGFAICLGILMSTTVSAFPSEPLSSVPQHSDDNNSALGASNQGENNLGLSAAPENSEHASESQDHQEPKGPLQESPEAFNPAAPESSEHGPESGDHQKPADDAPSADSKGEKKRTFIQKSIDRARKFLKKLDSFFSALGFHPSESWKHFVKHQAKQYDSEIAHRAKPSSNKQYPAEDGEIIEWENLVEEIVDRVEDATIQLDGYFP